MQKSLHRQRNSNLELLRIISMILIVMSHSDDWMGLAGKYSDICLNRCITDWLDMGGQIGVGCFVLISGYFMIDRKFSMKKIFRLLGQVWFYTISIFAVNIIAEFSTGKFNLVATLKSGIKAFFPVLFSHYWFVTAYVILLFLSPFFNYLINAMDKKTYQALLTTIIIIFVVINRGIPFALIDMSEGRLIPVFIMYFIAGYIKKYVSPDKDNSRKHFTVAILGYFALYATYIGIETVGTVLKSEKIISHFNFYRVLNSPIVLVINISLFLAFLRMKNIHGKAINSIASNTFGVYLIHQNQIIKSSVLPLIFPVYKETNSLKLLIYSIGSVATVYIACTLIDMIRQRTVEKLWFKILDAKYEKIELKIKYFVLSASEKIINISKKYYK